MRLATTLLSKVDPTFDQTEDSADPMLIPPYTQPIVVGGALPGGLHYLYISAPPTPGDTDQSTDKVNTHTANHMCTNSWQCIYIIYIYTFIQ